MTGWWRRFLVRGVFWRQFTRWGTFNVPIWIESLAIGFWTLFFLLWGPGRRGVMHNLKLIKPGSWSITNLFRVYRVFWNFAWTINENARFRSLGVIPDWEFEGQEHFESLQAQTGGAIILTAHMGTYDMGAEIFAQRSGKSMVMVRAPEIDPETHEFVEQEHERGGVFDINFNTRANDLALDLLHALRDGRTIAIQGDRVTPGIVSVETTLFGRPVRLPVGPFALAMAARAPLYPLFIVRRGRRHYRVVTCKPFVVERTGRDRDADLRRAIDIWSRELETIISRGWYQWFTFEPLDEEATA